MSDGSKEKTSAPVGLGDGCVLVAIYQDVENSINIKEIPKLETFIDGAEFFNPNVLYETTSRVSKNAREVRLTGGIPPVGMGDRWPEKAVGLDDRCRKV